MKGTSIRGLFLFVMLCAFVLAQAGFGWDVPITSKPTRKIEAALLGDWFSGNTSERRLMQVRKIDDFSYLVSGDGHFYRAYHSDIAGVPFLSVQDIDSIDLAGREYFYLTWNLSDGGKRLDVHMVNDDLIPEQTRSSTAVARILRRNVKNPALLKGWYENHFTRDRQSGGAGRNGRD